MHLKRLTMTGFKSFVEKTDFDFDRGVTCVVGPNGCGKSNVVDAIKWVLGAQSAKALRGRQMLDVIFNGSSSRKSSGMAQVDLVFDNSSGRLSVDQTEVVVSRRLYRNGDSEYLLNKQPTRLKDIRELFFDTGIGSNAYSIIEQGKVDVLLQASPIDRRTIFEEAAGISKYKAHRKEAVRRLDRVEQNLLRVQDKIDELEKRLRSIKVQAGRARSYQVLSERYRELRASFSMAEYHRLTERSKVLTAQLDEESDAASGLRSGISQCEADLSSIADRVADLDRAISQLDNELLTVQSEMTGNQERVEQLRDRFGELHESLAAARRRRLEERRRLHELSRELEREQASAEALERQEAEQASRIEHLLAEDREKARGLAELEARLDDDKAGIVELLRRAAQLHNEIENLGARREDLQARKDRLAQREAEIRSEIEDLTERQDTLARRVDEIARHIAARRDQLEQKRQAAAALDEQRGRIEQELAEAREHRSGLRSRHELLCQLDESREGVSDTVRQILHEADDQAASRFAYVEGLVADLFETDVEHAELIEGALGGLEQYLVVSDSQAMFGDQDALDAFEGCVRTICLDRLGPFISPRDFSAAKGFVAAADDLVRCDERHRPLMRHLLGRTVIAETLQDALDMAATSYGRYRFVAKTGQIIEPDGRVILGSAEAAIGLVSRKSQIRDLEVHIAQADRQIGELTERMRSASAAFDELQEAQKTLRQAIYEATIEQTETAGDLQQAEEEIRRLTKQQPLIAAELDTIERDVHEADRRTATAQEELTSLEARRHELEQACERLKAEIAQAEQDRQAFAEELTAARVEAGRIAQQKAGLADRLHALSQDRHRAKLNLQIADNEVGEGERRIVTAERGILRTEAKLASLYLSKERVHRRALTQRRERERVRLSSEQINAKLKAHRADLEQIDQRLGDVRVSLQDVNVRRDGLVARVRDELDIDLVAKAADYEPTEQDWTAVEAEIAEIRQKLDRLGNVNLDAIAEQDELEQRATFLTGQRDDLIASKNKLESLIQKLNRESRERFVQNFEAIRKHFQDLYRKLFGGGRADIILEDPNDVLECGIEIVARPPGKELQSISLLSGGEKTMTAVALLLGIFKSRPSPFAVLDEVDAALDEANNERFNGVVNEFLEHSQFIIITHSKRTMSIADVMYGVTMQEPGVSKRVSVRFENHMDQTSAVA